MTYLLHNLTKNYCPNNNYNDVSDLAGRDGLFTFDGIYQNVYENREHLKGKQLIFFVMGDYVGKDNRFDVGMPREKLCDWNEIIEMVTELKAGLGWHTWSHRDLTTLPYEEIVKEITPPFPMKYFAYPYGRFNDAVLQAVKDAGYEEAWSVVQGDNSQFQRLRSYL